MTRPRGRRGFSLAEVLVAIVILLIGVVVALKIFPAGFNLFSEAQQTHIALRMIKQTITGFEGDPDSLPDAIMPVYESDTALCSVNYLMSDLGAVEYAASSGTNIVPYSYYLAPVGNGTWPLWQPIGARVMRRVIGERCLIPSEVYNQTENSTSSAYNVSLLPKYVPRFGPIISNGHWDAATGTYQLNTGQDPITVYDLRYRRVTKDQLYGLLAKIDQLPDRLYYAVDYSTGEIWLLPKPTSASTTEDRRLKYTYYYKDSNAQVVSVQGLLKLDAPGVTVRADGNLVRVSGFLPASIIPGSELFNRAYKLIDLGTVMTRLANTPKNIIYSGEYYLPGYAGSGPDINAIFFSQADSGHVVKIDYTLADWNILHEDLTVDDDGYVTLQLPDPKITNKPGFPREPSTWGLFTPMKGDGYDVVMGLVDLRTGASYLVDYNEHANPKYTVDKSDPMLQFSPAALDSIDFTDSLKGRVRLGSATLNTTNPWKGVAGRKYRVYYRAMRDWTLQVYKPPSMFWRVADTSSLKWQEFVAAGNQIIVPAVYQGQSIAVDYQYRNELCRATDDTKNDSSVQVSEIKHLPRNSNSLDKYYVVEIDNPATPTVPAYAVIDPSGCRDGLLKSVTNINVGNGAFIYSLDTLCSVQNGCNNTAVIPVSSTANLKSGMGIQFFNPANPVQPISAAVFSVDSPTQITLLAPVTVSKDAVVVNAEHTSPLQRASGELHTLPVGGNTGVALLKHLPAPNTSINVRGMSVTVRTLWMQPRHGSAWVLDDGFSATAPQSTWKTRPLNEQWQGKSLTTILPAMRE